MNKKVTVKHKSEVGVGEHVAYLNGSDQKLGKVEQIEGDIVTVRPYNKSGCLAAKTVVLNSNDLVKVNL